MQANLYGFITKVLLIALLAFIGLGILSAGLSIYCFLSIFASASVGDIVSGIVAILLFFVFGGGSVMFCWLAIRTWRKYDAR